MNLGNYDRAMALFQKEIDEFPGSEMTNAVTSSEHGKTSAKSHLGVLQCHLAMGRVDDARAKLEDLKAFDESSWVDLPDGGRRTFREIGEGLITATLDEDDADEVGPEDVQS